MTPDDVKTGKFVYVPCPCGARRDCPRCRGFGEVLVPVRRAA